MKRIRQNADMHSNACPYTHISKAGTCMARRGKPACAKSPEMHLSLDRMAAASSSSHFGPNRNMAEIYFGRWTWFRVPRH